MFHLFDLFELDHPSWLKGYRHGRSGLYRGCPTFDSTGRYREMLRDVDIPAYMDGFSEGRKALMRETS